MGTVGPWWRCALFVFKIDALQSFEGILKVLLL